MSMEASSDAAVSVDHVFPDAVDTARSTWYNKRNCAYYIAFRSFFSPLTRQPKNVTNYTTAALRLWYNIGNIAQCGKSRFRENLRSDDGTFLKMYFVYLKKK